MQLYQMNDNDINDVMTMAMHSTIIILVAENLITDEQATAFRDTHVCLKIDNKSIWNRIKKMLSMEVKEDSFSAVVFSTSKKHD